MSKNRVVVTSTPFSRFISCSFYLIAALAIIVIGIPFLIGHAFS